ncbi:MAG: hypothetical protein ACJATF_004455, partial [Flavobacteriales bacterium]
MKKLLLLTCLSLCLSQFSFGQLINEFHYDNASGDTGEFVEIFIPNDGCSYEVILYNGSNGTSYGSSADYSCTSPVSNACGQAGSSGCFFVYSPSAIQNGGPDGIALVQDCGGTVTVLQFLSYEGTFTATNGSANGMTSTDVGVSEGGGTPIGASLEYGPDGDWFAAPDDTPGACNSSQGPLPVEIISFNVREEDDKQVSLSWSTASEENNSHFEIEHSTNGRDFQMLDKVIGNGTTAEIQEYNFM